MVRTIMRDPLFLAQKSEPATEVLRGFCVKLLSNTKVYWKDRYERWKRWWECGKGRQLLL